MVWYVVWYEILFHTTPYHTSVPFHEMPCAHDIVIGNIQDLISLHGILIQLLNNPVILHLDKSITVNPLYKHTHYNNKILYNVILICTEWLYYSNMYSLQQKTQFNVRIFRNKCCLCKEGPLYSYYY